MTDEVTEFCKKYDATVGRSGRMHHRARRVDYNVWSESDPAVFNTLPYDSLPMVEIHMPEDRFCALLEHYEWLYRARHLDYKIGNAGLAVAQQHEEECRIRHENPAVATAYAQYQMLLELCRH